MSHPGPKLVPLELTDEERDVLQGWIRKRKQAQDVALRARIVLSCDRTVADRVPVSQSQVARELGVSAATVRKWRRRFTERRLEGLTDAPRPGRPRALTKERLTTVITESVDAGGAHLSTRAVAARAGVSQSTACRVVRSVIPVGEEGETA
ncbi:helix-turn-helix domain-containing protein [Nocardiopsis halotolerans]|uniref:helix-turn-helix domain-containing protein n=1 Tax=Nocardiopsis halotolerans TaxID=124252 RepID=UPI0003457AC5|nr:helix-turn-helix domain-containing protein [Nocardiopsis halotolerans]